MNLLLPILLLPLAAALAVLRAVVRGADKRRLLAQAHGIGCSLSEEFGISLLCSGIDAPGQVDALLAPEYTRFEAILVLDAAADPDAFARLTARYRMIRVEWCGSQEFPQAAIRSLWRSRRRSCRRLVLVDRPQQLPQPGERTGSRWHRSRFERRQREADWLAAAAVASYDYLLPLAEGVALLPDAVTRLVAELGEYPAGQVQLLHAPVGLPVTLLVRDRLAEAGRFGWIRTPVPRRNRRILWEPLACRSGAPHPPALHPGVLLPLLFLLTGAAAAAGWWGVAALPATGAAIAGAGCCARRAVARSSGGRCTALREHP